MRAAWPVLVGCLLAFCQPTYAHDQPLNGTKLVIKVTPTGGKLVFVNLPFTNGAGWSSAPDNPTLVGGMFKVFDPATSESAVFDLPASNWSPAHTTGMYKFLNKEAPAGVSPARSVVHSSFRIRVAAREPGLLLPSGAQQIHVELQLGSEKWCATFANPKKTGPGLFLAGRQDTFPASCVDYWTPPTTTTTLAPCGGGPFSCGGACAAGLTCAPVSDFEPYCGCIPDGTQSCESETYPYCNGTCAGGGTCGPSGAFPFAPCICIPPGGTACGSASFPVCGGVCASGGECQSFDVDTLQFCACAAIGSLCGCGMPGTCPGDESCHVDPPCGCAP